MTPGTLSIVATPIGNPGDMTPRGARAIVDADLLVCEEFKEGRRLLRALAIEPRGIATLNEHSSGEEEETILAALEAGRNVALVSDCGTPVLADPGRQLVERAVARGVPVVPVPGASSFVAALMIAGFPVEEFVFRGMLSAKKDERRAQVRALRSEGRTIILFDAPYRLHRTVEDLAETFGAGRRAVLAMDLTTAQETVLRGTCADLMTMTNGKQWKREFVVVLGPTPAQEHSAHNRVR